LRDYQRRTGRAQRSGAQRRHTPSTNLSTANRKFGSAQRDRLPLLADDERPTAQSQTPELHSTDASVSWPTPPSDEAFASRGRKRHRFTYRQSSKTQKAGQSTNVPWRGTKVIDSNRSVTAGGGVGRPARSGFSGWRPRRINVCRHLRAFRTFPAGRVLWGSPPKRHPAEAWPSVHGRTPDGSGTLR